jgi:hypothetical protein
MMHVSNILTIGELHSVLLPFAYKNVILFLQTKQLVQLLQCFSAVFCSIP